MVDLHKVRIKAGFGWSWFHAGRIASIPFKDNCLDVAV